MAGTLFVVSGPSGSGKTTLIDWALKEIPNLGYSISYTSRRPREGEQQGIDYFFVDRAEFQQRVAAGEFLEWAEVYGQLYGTHRPQVESMLGEGYDILMDIDVQGARLLQPKFPGAVFVFVFPPSFAVLVDRIADRNLDSAGEIARRMRVAKEEMAAYDHYDFIIINDRLEQAQLELQSIIIAHRCRRAARAPQAQAILQSIK